MSSPSGSPRSKRPSAPSPEPEGHGAALGHEGGARAGEQTGVQAGGQIGGQVGGQTGELVELARGVKLELLTHGKRFLGLGRVEVGGVRLRGSRRPMFVELRTPEGIEFFDFEIARQTRAPGELVLEFSMKARAGMVQDWMAHTVRNLRTTRDWAEPEWTPDHTRLRLHLCAVEETFRGRLFQGFEYYYDYESPEYPIYRLLDRSSWAIGESVAGNTFWLRNCFAPSLRTFQGADDFYSTEWYLGNISNPNIFQFQPFQTNMESFTMTTAEQGQLLTVAPLLSHIRSFFEKPRGAGELLHWHEHCNDLSSRFTTTPVQVLFSGQPATRADLINLNEAVRDRVYEGLHRQAGLRRERITTYGSLEEWTKPDFEDYTHRILPKFLEAGVRCIFVPNQFQNNMNVWNVENMCCTIDYKPVDERQEAQIRRFCERAREGGACVQTWGNTSISTLDFILRPQMKGERGRADFLPEADSIFEVLDKVADPYVRNPSGAIEADHYTPVFAVLNLREPLITAYWHRRWKEAHDRIGFGGIFLDSSFNLSSDKFHFTYNAPGTSKGATADQSDLIGQVRPAREPRKAVQTMYFAHLQLIAEMQRYGYHYCGEDIGVFGLRRGGPGLDKRLGSLFLWGDCYAPFHRSDVIAAGADPDEVFFRGLAYRVSWQLNWNFKLDAISFKQPGGSEEDLPTPWQWSILRAFNETEAAMHERTVLEDEVGVLYKASDEAEGKANGAVNGAAQGEAVGRQILWAFQSFDFALPPGATARDVLTGETVSGPTLHAQKHHVYCIE